MVSEDFAKCALRYWGDDRRSGNKINLGYPGCNQIGRWMREGIVPHTKHKPDDQGPNDEVIEHVNSLWKTLNIINIRAGRAIEAHYRYAEKVAPDRYRLAKLNKSEYYRQLEIGHEYIARNL